MRQRQAPWAQSTPRLTLHPVERILGALLGTLFGHLDQQFGLQDVDRDRKVVIGRGVEDAGADALVVPVLF